MRLEIKRSSILSFIGLLFVLVITEAGALTYGIIPQPQTKKKNYCKNQPDGYIYTSKINNSCKKSRTLVTGETCWKCFDKCTKKTHPYTAKDCSRQGLEHGEDFCITIDNIKRYKTCNCPKGYYLQSELNFDTSVFEYDSPKETLDGQIKCYRPLNCKNKKKITASSGLTIEGEYAWKNPCSKLKIVSSLNDLTKENNFYCAVKVECNKDLNCFKDLQDQECVVKEKDDSATSFYQEDNSTCYYYKNCIYDGICLKEQANNCVNIKSTAVNLYDAETQKTGKAICRQFIHGKNGCLEGFSITKKYLCTRFDRVPKTTEGLEVDSISYDRDELTINGLRQSCRKYAECKFGYEEYKPEKRGLLTANDIEEAKENDAYEVSYVKSINGDKEEYIICRKYTGCKINKCDISCDSNHSWMRYFMPPKK